MDKNVRIERLKLLDMIVQMCIVFLPVLYVVLAANSDEQAVILYSMAAILLDWQILSAVIHFWVLKSKWISAARMVYMLFMALVILFVLIIAMADGAYSDYAIVIVFAGGALLILLELVYLIVTIVEYRKLRIFGASANKV